MKTPESLTSNQDRDKSAVLYMFGTIVQLIVNTVKNNDAVTFKAVWIFDHYIHIFSRLMAWGSDNILQKWSEF